MVGAHANGLGIVRALAAWGVRTVVVATRPFDVGQLSRHVEEAHWLPIGVQGPVALLELLEENARRWEGWAVFPSTDDALTVLARHHARLSRHYRLTVQPWEVAGPLVDKDRMHELARRVGLAIPTCHGAADGKALAQVSSYPVLVKPIQHDRLIHSHGVKLFLARDAEELRHASARLEEAGEQGLVYDLVPGPDSNLYVYCLYMDRTGEPSPGITVRKLRQNPPVIGGARVAEVVTEIPELREATVALLQRAGFRGIAFAEFKLDPRNGRYLFIEVNGRAAQFNSILPPTGVDLVAMAWQDFALGERPRAQPTGWQGSWIHLQADLLCSFFYRRQERHSFTDLLAPYRKPKTFAIWSAADPVPFMAQAALAARGALVALTRRNQRQALHRRLRGEVPREATAGRSRPETSR